MPNSTPARPDADAGPDEVAAWQCLLALRERAGALDRTGPIAFGIGRGPTLCDIGDPAAVGRIDWTDDGWQLELDSPHPFFSLYLPLCEPVTGRARVLGHLGQSIDGYIATASGDSDYVSSRENIRHLHRLRALHDAVIVGAGTIASDNPQLTTRHVAGPNPVRVVLDSRRRLPPDAGVFSDGAAPTLLVTAESADGPDRHGAAAVIRVPTSDHGFDLAVLVERLAERGLARLFVEGGGATVSSFFDAGLLDRLQIAIAPVLIGRGKPGLRLAPRQRMRDCPRPAHRFFELGEDLLIDCDLRANEAPAARDAGVAIRRLR